MNYNEILNILSVRHKTSTAEVDKEICDALQQAGIQMSAEEFIGKVAEIVRRRG